VLVLLLPVLLESPLLFFPLSDSSGLCVFVLVFIHTTIRWACSSKDGMSMVNGVKEGKDKDEDNEELLFTEAGAAAVEFAEA